MKIPYVYYNDSYNSMFIAVLGADNVPAAQSLTDSAGNTYYVWSQGAYASAMAAVQSALWDNEGWETTYGSMAYTNLATYYWSSEGHFWF